MSLTNCVVAGDGADCRKAVRVSPNGIKFELGLGNKCDPEKVEAVEGCINGF